jgi:hypothetical protein
MTISHQECCWISASQVSGRYICSSGGWPARDTCGPRCTTSISAVSPAIAALRTCVCHLLTNRHDCTGLLLFNCCAAQGVVSRLIFSGAHPGRGLRNVSEAHAMVEAAHSLVEQPPPAGRCGLSQTCTLYWHAGHLCYPKTPGVVCAGRTVIMPSTVAGQVGRAVCRSAPQASAAAVYCGYVAMRKLILVCMRNGNVNANPRRLTLPRRFPYFIFRGLHAMLCLYTCTAHEEC